MEFLDRRFASDYLADKGLRALIERKLFVVGEAVSQLRSEFPEVAEELPSVNEIIGFRNLLAHAHFALNHIRVYEIATQSLPTLLEGVSIDIERGFANELNFAVQLSSVLSMRPSSRSKSLSNVRSWPNRQAPYRR